MQASRFASFVPSFNAESRNADDHRMFRGGLAREHTCTDQALAHVCTKNSEYLTDLVSADGARASLSFFVRNHFELNDEKKLK